MEMSIDQIIQQIMAGHSPENMTTCSAPEYQCNACHDTGWVQFEKDGDTYCRECECVKARNARRLMEKSGLKDVLEQKTFATFIAENDMQSRIKAAAQGYLQALFSVPSDAPRKPWLYIGGNPGSGKTHICTAVCGELLKANREVVYMQWIQEARRLKAYINEPDFESVVAKFTDCEILYIDDLYKQTYHGTPILTDADVKMAFTIFNARYLENKPTIISSEWSLNSLMEADEGVFSRVYERCKEHYCFVPRDAKYNYRLARVKGATA